MMCLFVSFTAVSQTTTSQDGAWNSATTWGGSVPTSGTDVVIAHDVSCSVLNRQLQLLQCQFGKTHSLSKMVH